jgi:hypothetical protein
MIEVAIWHWHGLGQHTYVMMDGDTVAKRFNDPAMAVLWVKSRLDKKPKERVKFVTKSKRWHYRDGD